MQGIIDKVAVLILDSSGSVVERYVINLKVWYTTSRDLPGPALQKFHCPRPMFNVRSAEACLDP